MEERQTVPVGQPPAGLSGAAAAEAAKLADQARERATSYVSGQKSRAADSIAKLAGAMLQAAHTLDEEGEMAVGRYALSAAQRMDGMARYVRDADMRRFASDAKAFARRHPAVFIGGTFLAGVALARFLKSSRRGAEPNVRPQPYEVSPYGDVPYTPEPMPVTRPVGG